MPESGERIIIFSANCLRQRLHKDFKNAFWNKESKERANDTEVENQATGYCAMVSKKSDMPLSVCEVLHRIVRAVL